MTDRGTITVPQVTDATDLHCVRCGSKAITVAELRELYVDKRYSDQEIATAAGVHRVTVTRWRMKYGIRRDEREAVTL